MLESEAGVEDEEEEHFIDADKAQENGIFSKGNRTGKESDVDMEEEQHERKRHSASLAGTGRESREKEDRTTGIAGKDKRAQQLQGQGGAVSRKEASNGIEEREKSEEEDEEEEGKGMGVARSEEGGEGGSMRGDLQRPKEKYDPKHREPSFWCVEQTIHHLLSA